MELSELKTSVKDLKNIPLDSPAFDARIATLFWQIEHMEEKITHDIEDENIESKPIIESLIQLRDDIRYGKQLISKISSSKEVVESFLKRKKLNDELSALERQLRSVSEYLRVHEDNTIFLNSFKDCYLESVDYENCRNMLIEMKLYLDQCDQDDPATEHSDSVQQLIEYINNLIEYHHLSTSNGGTIPTFQCLPNEIKNLLWKPFKLPNRRSSQDSSFSILGLVTGSSNSGLSTNLGFGSSFYGVWNGALVSLKKVPVSAFQDGLLGLTEAARTMRVNSDSIKNSPFFNHLLGVLVETENSNFDGTYDLEKEFFHFVTPLAPYGSLFSLLTDPEIPKNKKPTLEPSVKMSILFDIIRGLNHLHESGLVHGRLKDTNVLLFDGFKAKLSDFGVDWLLSNKTRKDFKGTNGIRWCSAEELKADSEWEEMQKQLEYQGFLPQKMGFGDNNRETNKTPTVEIISHCYPRIMPVSVDSYGFGLILLGLLSENIPYYNEISDENIKTHILSGVLPEFPSDCPYMDVLGNSKFEEELGTVDLINNCIKKCLNKVAFDRPNSKEILGFIRDSYLIVKKGGDLKLKQENEVNIELVQKEISEFTEKVQDQVELVSRGKALIAKKDAEKIMIHDGKQRALRTQEIEKARDKLRNFEAELKELKEDLAGAQGDMAELFKLKKEIDERLEVNSKIDGIENIDPIKYLYEYDKEVLLTRYYPRESDQEKMESILYSSHENSLDTLFTPSLTPQPSFHRTSVIRDSFFQDTNPPDLLTSRIIEPKYSLNPKRESLLLTELSSGKKTNFAYSQLIDNLDIIFRLPINPKLLEFDNPAIRKNSTENTYNLNQLRLSNPRVDNSFSVLNQNNSILKPVSKAIEPSEKPSQKPIVRDIQAKIVPVVAAEHKEHSFESSGFLERPSIEMTSKMDGPSGERTSKVKMPRSSFKEMQSSELDSDDDEDVDKDEEQLKKSFEVRARMARGLPNRNLAQSIKSSITTTGGVVAYTVVSPLQKQNRQSIRFSSMNSSIALIPEDVNIEEDLNSIRPKLATWLEDNYLEPLIVLQYYAAAQGSWEEAVGMLTIGRKGLSIAEMLEFQNNNFNPLHLAAMRGHYQVFNLLAAHFQNSLNPRTSDYWGRTALHYSSWRGHLLLTKCLVEDYELDPQEFDQLGTAPIHLACIRGCQEVVEYFMEQAPVKVPVTFIDPEYGASLLHWSALHYDPIVIEYFLTKHKMNVETKATSDNSTCLLWASFGSSLTMVRHLIESSAANFTATDASNSTCLHMATLSGSVDKSLYFLENVRLNITDKNNDHVTPFDIAKGECRNFLLERKAKGFVTGSFTDKAKKIKKKYE